MASWKVTFRGLTHVRSKTPLEIEDFACQTRGASTHAPVWFEFGDELERCLAMHPRHLTFIVTARGAGRSDKAAAQWFSAACRKAGLAGLSAQGIRKGRAAIFKENRATPEHRMAILGHETEAHAHNYSKSAELRKIISGT